MSLLLDIFVVYQENGLPHEKLLQVPAGLSNTEFLDFINTDIGETANILNMINLNNVNAAKPAAPVAAEAVTYAGGRPERRSDSRPRFGGDAVRPYPGRSGGYAGGKSAGGQTGGYAKRSPRDGAKPGRGGVFNERPGKGSSRDARMGAAKAKRPLSKGR